MIDKILITGFSGFVAHHFIHYLNENHIEADVLGVDILNPGFSIKQFADLKIAFKTVDLLDIESLKEVIDEFRPNYLIHLAAFSSVAYSWKYPVSCFKNNTNIFLNLISAVRESNLSCRILSIGSSEEYGKVSRQDLPLNENSKLNPVSPYAVARISQEMLAKLYVQSFDMDIILTRSFNHIGIWQDDRFAVPSFIKKIYAIKYSSQEKNIITVGDLGVVRDFVDVRDVVAAYYKLLKVGRQGEIYNVCSGTGHQLKEVIEIISKELGVVVQTVIDPSLIRPDDNPILIGDNKKIKDELGWEPKYIFENTIKEMISYYINN